MFAALLILFVLLLLNGFFALSELAVVSANRALLKQMAKDGKPGAQTALHLAEKPGTFLSTVQVGITLVGILAGAVSGETFAAAILPWIERTPLPVAYHDEVAFALAVVFITYLSVVIGELVPKQIALRYPELLARVAAPVMSVISIGTRPLVWALDRSARLLLRLLGMHRKSEVKMTEHEVRAMMAEGVENGAIEPEEFALLQRIIRLGDRDVRSIMTHRREMMSLDLDAEEAASRELVVAGGHAYYPVVEKEVHNVVGVVAAKDMLTDALQGKPLQLRARMKPPLIVPDMTSCLMVMERFKAAHVNMAVVVDEYGDVQGVVTLSDLLEAVVGTMSSNYKVGADPMIVARDGNSWLIDGITAIEEVNVALQAGLPIRHDYDTLAGYMLYKLGRVANTGDRLEDEGFEFEVVDMDGRRIDKLMVTRLTPTDTEEPGEDQ